MFTETFAFNLLMGRVLEKEGVITSNRHHGLRLSFHYYNVPEDVDAVFDVLERHPELMVRTN